MANIAGVASTATFAGIALGAERVLGSTRIENSPGFIKVKMG
jgi:hypothetical protein